MPFLTSTRIAGLRSLTPSFEPEPLFQIAGEEATLSNSLCFKTMLWGEFLDICLVSPSLTICGLVCLFWFGPSLISLLAWFDLLLLWGGVLIFIAWWFSQSLKLLQLLQFIGLVHLKFMKLLLLL